MTILRMCVVGAVVFWDFSFLGSLYFWKSTFLQFHACSLCSSGCTAQLDQVLIHVGPSWDLRVCLSLPASRNVGFRETDVRTKEGLIV